MNCFIGAGCCIVAHLKAKSEFTIIELLIVIVVLAVLTSRAIVSYRSAQLDQREQKHATDMLVYTNAIQKAL